MEGGQLGSIFSNETKQKAVILARMPAGGEDLEILGNTSKLGANKLF